MASTSGPLAGCAPASVTPLSRVRAGGRTLNVDRRVAGHDAALAADMHRTLATIKSDLEA